MHSIVTVQSCTVWGVGVMHMGWDGWAGLWGSAAPRGPYSHPTFKGSFVGSQRALLRRGGGRLTT